MGGSQLSEGGLGHPRATYMSPGTFSNSSLPHIYIILFIVSNLELI
jgi:hypothetical protein